MRIILVTICLLFASCGSLRVLQDKVPSPVEKTDKHTNEERKGAYYLASNTSNENQMVANVLSRSLGTPTETENNPNKIAENLSAEIRNLEKRQKSLNEKLNNLQGKDIEGTGFNLLPYFSGMGIFVLIALLVLFPSLITVLFFILRRTRSALGNIVTGIKEYSDNDPIHAQKLKDLLDRRLDRAEKKLSHKMEKHG